MPFTGEGGTNTGNWHEGMNMAAIWSLPVIFVLENNHYAVSTNVEDMIKVKDLSLRAQAYGIPGKRVDGFDAIAVYTAAAEAAARARRGDGPTLLVTECVIDLRATTPANRRCTVAVTRSRILAARIAWPFPS